MPLRASISFAFHPSALYTLLALDRRVQRQLVYSERDEDDGRRSGGELLDERDIEADEARHVLEAEAGRVDRVLGRVLLRSAFARRARE